MEAEKMLAELNECPAVKSSNRCEILESKEGVCMKAKYLGESSPVELINGKIYNVEAIENGLYRLEIKNEKRKLRRIC